jgi:hypothetical protein
MKHGYKILPVLLAACWPAFFLAGCAADKTPVFISAASVPTLSAKPVSTPTVTGLSKDDETKIELEVFRTLLTRHLWDESGITAIFIEADDSEIAQLRKEFPGIIPPIKLSDRIDLSSRSTPLDKDTGKRAVILSVELSSLAADGSVPATGKWYSGSANAGFYSFVLKKNGDDWQIQNPP